MRRGRKVHAAIAGFVASAAFAGIAPVTVVTAFAAATGFAAATAFAAAAAFATVTAFTAVAAFAAVAAVTELSLHLLCMRTLFLRTWLASSPGRGLYCWPCRSTFAGDSATSDTLVNADATASINAALTG